MPDRTLALIVTVLFLGLLALAAHIRYKRRGLDLGPPPEREDDIGM